MGGSTSSSNTNANQSSNQTSTSTPIVPTNVADSENSYLSQIQSLINGASPTSAASLVAPVSASQTAAYNGASGLTTSPYFSDAATTAGQYANGVSPIDTTNVAQVNVNPASLYGGTTVAPASQMSSVDASGLINEFLNPNTNAVVNSTLALQNQQNGIAQAQLEAQGATSGAFGGSRFGLAQGNLAAQQGLANSNLAANLYNTAYTNALGAAQTQAAQNQSANAANQNALNSQSQLQANLTQQTGLTNTSAINTVSAQQAAINAAAAQQNATAANNNAQFNSSQNLAAQQAAANLFAGLGTSATNAQNQNIATQLAAGQDQRSVQAQQNAAQLNQLSALQQLLGVNPTSLFGQTSTGSGTTTGSSNGGTTSFGANLSSLFG